MDYLNTQASRLEAVTYERATVTAKQGLISMPSLRGDLAASQPKNFRMRGQRELPAAKIDLGSNEQQFWLFIDAPSVRPTYVFASHSDFESGKAKIPEGIPFEPDWVMQALGMTKFQQNVPYEQVKLDEKARSYTLSWPATTPAGMPIRKEIVFAADDADSSRDQPQVKKHVIRDVKGRVICTAEVKRAKTVPVGGSDPRTGHALRRAIPDAHRVELGRTALRDGSGAQRREGEPATDTRGDPEPLLAPEHPGFDCNQPRRSAIRGPGA